MIRLHIVAEGQTEEAFVNDLLAVHLGDFGVSADVRCVETSRTRRRIYRGGVSSYLKIKRVKMLEKAFGDDIGHRRFVPYIQLHEFEALLLSDPSAFAAQFLSHDKPIEHLIQLAAQHESPELINDGPTTAPSKRIIQQIPEYEGAKVSVGPLIAAKIGLLAIRQKCPHFDEWLRILKQLGT